MSLHTFFREEAIVFMSFSKNTLTPNFEPKRKRKIFFKGPEIRWYRDVTTS